MANKWKKVAAVAVSLAMASSIAVGMTGCGNKTVAPYEVNKRERTGWKDEKEYTLNDYTSQMPSAWNELTQSDAANSSLVNYINGSFFEFDYKYENGEVVPGEFTVQYSGATALEDVTSIYAGQYGLANDATKNHAFRITLRQDLQWDDGTPIKAGDFVYTMKQQLSPNYLFDNASNYYSANYTIHNAKDYLYQGQKGWYSANTPYTTYSEDIDSKLIFNIGSSTENAEKGNATCYMRSAMGFGSASAEVVANYLATNVLENVTKEQILALQNKTFAEIKADNALKATWDAIIGWWKTEPNEELHFFITEYEWPEVTFEQVGYFAPSDYELVIVIDNELTPVDDQGNLTYHAAYELSGFPLVKEELWEANADKTRTPWINTYCSSLSSSASWGPYKLTNFEADTTYTVSRNDKWYGYNMSRYDDQFQADKITVRNVKEWNTAWLSFQKGEFDTVSINPSIASKYKNSSQAYFTPSTGSGLINFQSNAEALTKERGNIMLKYPEFRQAMSLAMDRADFAATQTTSSLPMLGCLNDMYYYDVENGGVYRETVQAKEGLLRAYGATKNTDNGNWTVGGVEYDDIDDAMDALTGYNVTLARELVQQAYDKALAAGDIKAGDKITLTWGVQNQNADTERERKWLENSFKQALVGTPLQGKLEVKYFTTTNETWIDDFIEDGKYDICFGGWQNAAFNPYYLFNAAFLLDENRYAVGWEPRTEELTLTIDGEEDPITMSLYDWGEALTTGVYATAPTDTRLTILAALEEAVLKTYWSIPVYASYSASLISYKIDYYSYDYNTFMGYGGLQYMTFNYDDTEWAAFVKSKGTLIYNFNEIKVKAEDVSDAD